VSAASLEINFFIFLQITLKIFLRERIDPLSNPRGLFTKQNKKYKNFEKLKLIKFTAFKMMKYDNEQLVDKSACAGVRADLKMCLLESDCCKIVRLLKFYFEIF
jgi:hypothetical protein